MNKKRKIPRLLRRRSPRVELVAELAAPANDDLPAVGEDVVGGVPAALCKRRVGLPPVAGGVGAGRVGSGSAFAVVVATGLEEGAIGEDGGGGAPGIGEDGEGADGVGSGGVLDGVSSAVEGEGGVVGVAAAPAVGEGDVGGAEVGAVEDEDAVGVEELHVHGGYADVRVEEGPLAGGGKCEGSPVGEEE